MDTSINQYIYLSTRYNNIGLKRLKNGYLPFNLFSGELDRYIQYIQLPTLILNFIIYEVLVTLVASKTIDSILSLLIRKIFFIFEALQHKINFLSILFTYFLARRFSSVQKKVLNAAGNPNGVRQQFSNFIETLTKIMY